jgi:hypothetical protein
LFTAGEAGHHAQVNGWALAASSKRGFGLSHIAARCIAERRRECLDDPSRMAVADR